MSLIVSYDKFWNIEKKLSVFATANYDNISLLSNGDFNTGEKRFMQKL